MKTPLLLTAARHGLLLLLLALGLSALTGRAQTTQYMTYQGYLTDGNGNVLGSTNTGPTSYSVVFRIWNLPTGGVTNSANELWAELQTVTVNAGYFSLLLGQGTTYNTEPRGQLASVFTNSATYIEMTVLGIGTAGANVTLLPRLQFVNAPYAFSAANAGTANALVNGGGTQLIGTSVSGTTNVVSLTGGVINLTGNVYCQSLIATNSITVNSSQTTHNQGAYMEWNKNNGDGGTWFLNQKGNGAGGFNFGEVSTANSVTNQMVITGSGSVGIGTTGPDNLFSVNGTMDAAGLLSANGGLYINNSATGFHQSSLGAFNVDASGVSGGRLTVTAAGLVGISNSTPGALLDVGGNMQVSANGTIEVPGSRSTFNGMIETYNAAGDRYGLGQFGDGITALYASSTFSPGSIQFGLMTGASSFTSQMTVAHNGFVGIGVTNPAESLDVNGNINVNNHLVFNNAGAGVLDFNGALYIRADTTSGNIGTFADVMHITAGNPALVGINTASPSKGVLEVDGTINVSGDTVATIYAAGNVDGNAFNAHSDARIKNIQGVSDGAADLAVLKRIEITDFKYKDVAAYGDRPNKKVIAQQVETVYPQAVSRTMDEVPDIYQSAPVKDGWVQLATNLKVGEKVRLVLKGQGSVREVLAVRPGAFRTDYTNASTVLVYGRQVNDFRVVDYDAIAMLNVSATQEMARHQDAQDKEIADLKQEIADLKHLVVALSTTAGNSKQASATPEAAPKTVTTASLDR